MVARNKPLDCGFDNEPKLSTSPARAHWTLNLLAPLVALLGPSSEIVACSLLLNQ